MKEYSCQVSLLMCCIVNERAIPYATRPIVVGLSARAYLNAPEFKSTSRNLLAFKKNSHNNELSSNGVFEFFEQTI